MQAGRRQKSLWGQQELDQLIPHSLEIINQVRHLQPVTVGFSGGKDSIVLAHLTQLSGIQHQLVYLDTTIDPPEMKKFIRTHYPHAIIKHPKTNFFKLLLTLGPPSILKRWCCRLLKHGRDKSPVTLLGVRKEESIKRSKYQPITTRKDGNKTSILVYPILNWPEWAVWQYIESNKLVYPTLYEDRNRIGCIICPYISWNEHQIRKKYYPKHYAAFEKHFGMWLHKKYGGSVNSREVIDAWYRNYGVLKMRREGG